MGTVPRRPGNYVMVAGGYVIADTRHAEHQQSNQLAGAGRAITELKPQVVAVEEVDADGRDSTLRERLTIEEFAGQDSSYELARPTTSASPCAPASRPQGERDPRRQRWAAVND